MNIKKDLYDMVQFASQWIPSFAETEATDLLERETLVAADPANTTIYHWVDGPYPPQNPDKVTIVDPQISLDTLMSHVLHRHRHDIQKSNISRAIAIAFLEDKGYTHPRIADTFADLIDIPKQARMVQQYSRLTRQPQNILSFCHDKQLSLKQIQHLLSLNTDILSHVLDWRQQLPLSTSLVIDLADLIRNDTCKRQISIQEFESDPDFQDCLNGSGNSSDKIRRLQTFISERRNPILNQSNRDRQAQKEEAALPSHVDVSWDRTLENRGIHIQITARNREDIQSAIDQLSQKDTLDILDTLIEMT